MKGFDKAGGLVLDNGWTVPPEFGHIAHGLVSTSHAAQGKTVDRVLIAMGSESRGAINAEQFYVSVSRGRESARIFTDLLTEERKQAIERTDTRKSATELMHPRKKPKTRRKRFIERLKDGFDQLRDRMVSAIRETALSVSLSHQAASKSSRSARAFNFPVGPSPLAAA